MSPIDELFRSLRAEKRKALMPFVTAGDPDLDFTREVLCSLAREGCQLFEVGIPYSDPIADGPVIQASYTRALARGVKLADIFAMLRGLSQDPSFQKNPAPRVTMASYAIVHRHGLERYVEDAQAAGISGAIVPDLLVEESSALAAVCKARDFSLIQLITPTTPRERAKRIAEAASGFIYYVSVTGITGERRALPPELIENVNWLRGQTELPICIGFGISQPEHVKQLAPVADGLIVGSAFVRRMAAAHERPRAEVLQEVSAYAAELLAALETA